MIRGDIRDLITNNN